MNKEQYDVIIIGGGPAGSTSASTLVQLGHSVLLLEKAKFPREHVGESLLPFCYQIFQDLGVLEKMEANFTRKPGVTFSNIDGSSYSNWCFAHVIKDPSYLSFHVRRAKFDHMLLQNSIEKGAKVWEETKVLEADFTSSDESVTIIAERNGKRMDLNARFVIDASGQDTLLANQLKCKKPFERLNTRVAYSTHWVNLNWDESLKEGNIKIVHLEGEKLGWLWMIPIGEDRLSIGLAVNMDYAKAQRRELSKTSDDWVKDFYLQELKSSSLASKIINGAKIAQPISANGDFSYYADQKFGDRYAMVGDASGFLDPIFSSGIYLGMKGGQRVAHGVSDILNQKGRALLNDAYKDIEGAYKLVENLINTFYQPDSIKWAGADKAFDQSYEKFESAYSILHLILAGDFFTNHEKYIKAIELLRNKSMIEKYRNLIKHPEVEKGSEVCKRIDAV